MNEKWMEKERERAKKEREKEERGKKTLLFFLSFHHSITSDNYMYKYVIKLLPKQRTQPVTTVQR